MTSRMQFSRNCMNEPDNDVIMNGRRIFYEIKNSTTSPDLQPE